MEVVKNLLFRIVTYIWVKRVIEKEKKIYRDFYHSVTDWMEIDLNVSLQSDV